MALRRVHDRRPRPGQLPATQSNLYEMQSLACASRSTVRARSGTRTSGGNVALAKNWRAFSGSGISRRDDGGRTRSRSALREGVASLLYPGRRPRPIGAARPPARIRRSSVTPGEERRKLVARASSVTVDITASLPLKKKTNPWRRHGATCRRIDSVDVERFGRITGGRRATVEVKQWSSAHPTPGFGFCPA